MAIKAGIAGVRGLSCTAGLNDIPDVKAEALCDLNEVLLKEQVQKFNIPKTYRGYAGV